MEEEKDKAEEPVIEYPAKKITFFSSIEEANEYDASERAKRSPEENLEIVYKIIQAFYKHNLKKAKAGTKRIIFKNYEYLNRKS
jgi:hypothetical protein